MRPVAIVGSDYRSMGYAPWGNNEIEIWGFNEHLPAYPRFDVGFQIHTHEVMSGGEAHKNWLRVMEKPVYMREKYEEYPTSIAYPFEDVFNLTRHILQGTSAVKPLKFLTSSVPYAIALAILQNRPRIEVYGVEMSSDVKEYTYQREGFAFWIGFAGGKGIPLLVHCGNSIFDKPIYGDKKL